VTFSKPGIRHGVSSMDVLMRNPARPSRPPQWADDLHPTHKGVPVQRRVNSYNQRDRITRAQVGATAVDCFQKFGVHRTTMLDVANAMGISRQTLYRLFESRPALMEYVATTRVETVANRIADFVTRFEDLQEAIVEGIIFTIKCSREDEILMEITRQSRDAEFTVFLFGGAPEVQKLMLGSWSPLLKKARAAGAISADTTDDQIVDWMCSITAFLNLREDYEDDDHRRILRQFVVPSIVRNAQLNMP
jgi:AcrR family transcriptional regulator